MAAKSHDFIKINSNVPQIAPLTEAGSISAYLRNEPDKCGCLARQIPHRHLIGSSLCFRNPADSLVSFGAVVVRYYSLQYNQLEGEI